MRTGSQKTYLYLYFTTSDLETVMLIYSIFMPNLEHMFKNGLFISVINITVFLRKAVFLFLIKK